METAEEAEMGSGAEAGIETLLYLGYSPSSPTNRKKAILFKRQDLMKMSPVFRKYSDAVQDGNRIFRDEDNKLVEVPISHQPENDEISRLTLHKDVAFPALEVLEDLIDLGPETVASDLEELDIDDVAAVMTFSFMYAISPLDQICLYEEEARHDRTGNALFEKYYRMPVALDWPISKLPSSNTQSRRTVACGYNPSSSRM